jgi:DNA repair exonuclease SbcCD ATPase subunit
VVVIVNYVQAAKTAAKSETSSLHQELTKKDNELKTLRDRSATLQKELNDLKEQLQIKNTEVKDLRQKASTLGEEKEQHAREVRELKEQMQRTKSGNDKSKKAEIDRLIAEVGDLTRQLQSKNAHVKELNQQASAHGGEKDQLAKEVERLRGELLEMQKIRSDDGKTKQAEIDRLTEQLGKLRGQLQIKDSEVEELEQLVDTRREEKKQLMAENEQLQAQLLKMQRASASSTGNSEAKVHQLTKQLSTQAKESERKTREIEQLRQDLACAQENIAELMGASGGVGPGVRATRPTDRKATTPVDARAGDASHTCPVCDKTLRVSQAEFERHMNSHFN